MLIERLHNARAHIYNTHETNLEMKNGIWTFSQNWDAISNRQKYASYYIKECKQYQSIGISASKTRLAKYYLMLN